MRPLARKVATLVWGILRFGRKLPPLQDDDEGGSAAKRVVNDEPDGVGADVHDGIGRPPYVTRPFWVKRQRTTRLLCNTTRRQSAPLSLFPPTSHNPIEYILGGP